MNLKYLAILSQASIAANFAHSLSTLFRYDSLPNRVLGSLHPALIGVDCFATVMLSRERRHWPRHRRMTPIVRGIERYGELVSTFDWSNTRISVWKIGEHVAMWSSDDPDDLLCTKSPVLDIAHEVLRHALADLGPDTRLALTEAGFVEDTEYAPKVMTSSIRDVAERLRVEMAKRHRSVLLHGPAGAGKTAAARQLAEALAGTTIVVTSELLSQGLESDVFSLLSTWKPDCVILDDVDRAIEAGSESWLLGGLTRLRAAVPLVIATANTKGEFSGAVLRPGRFDRVLDMDRLDESIVREQLSRVPIEVQDQAVEAGLIGSYLDELAFRVDCGGDAQADFEEMLTRQQMAGDGYERIDSVEKTVLYTIESGVPEMHG